MAHFAQLDDKNIVTQVIVLDNDAIKDNSQTEVEAIGVALCQHLVGSGTKWKQTSYTASNGTGFRGNYAGIGYTYMTNVETLGVACTDIFIPQQPFPSWSIGISTAEWYSPLGLFPVLTDSELSVGKRYFWDEAAYQSDTNSPKTVGWVLTGG